MADLPLLEQIYRQFLMRWQDLLQALMRHVELVFISMLLAIVIGIPLGILITRVKSLQSPVLGVASVLQTIPSLALLGFMIPLFGIGSTAAIAALFLYSLLPIIRNTFTGIREVDPATIEAAKGMGMTSPQILFKIELPLAFGVIMAGIRTSTVINVGTATLAAFIGAGGLGDFILLGIQRAMNSLVLLGAFPAAILALFLDWLLGILERLSTPRGLKQ